MAATWKFYSDAGLVSQITTLVAQQSTVRTYETKRVYFGSIEAGKTLYADSNPGVDPIVISLVDAFPGSDLDATDVRLALSEAGLASATPGASLSLGTSLSSGVGNAVVLWVRFYASGEVPGVHTDLKLQTVALAEV